MKSLYDKNYRLTEQGNDLDNRTQYQLSDLFCEFIRNGFSPREIAHLMHSSIIDLELAAVMDVVPEDIKNGKDFEP